MKNKPFQFRYVNEIVGAFVLLVIALLIAAVFIAGRAQGWFEPVYRIPLDFPPQGSLDLQIGSPVQILGTTVGRVEQITVDDDGFMTGLITVKGAFYQFVRTDSRVIVKKKFGVAGDAYVDIGKGSGPELPPGGGLVAIKDTDLNELLQDLLGQIRETTVPLLESVKNAVDQYAGLGADMRSADGPLQKVLLNVESITRKIDQGEGPAGKIIGDKEMADSIQQMVTQLQEAVAQIQVILDDVPGTVVQTRETVREAERLIEGLQRHWLLRKYIPQTEPTALIPSYDIRIHTKPVSTGAEESVP